MALSSVALRSSHTHSPNLQHKQMKQWSRLLANQHLPAHGQHPMQLQHTVQDITIPSSSAVPLGAVLRPPLCASHRNNRCGCICGCTLCGAYWCHCCACSTFNSACRVMAPERAPQDDLNIGEKAASTNIKVNYWQFWHLAEYLHVACKLMPVHELPHCPIVLVLPP